MIAAVGGMAGSRDGVKYTTFVAGQHVKYSKAKVVDTEINGVSYDLITDEFITLIKDASI